MFSRAAKNKFAIADYNLGYLEEKNNQLEKSIEFYKKASDNEDSPLIFRNCPYFDKRLEISIKFILCYTNLKLTNYYFEQSEFEESKKYFIRSFLKITNDKNFSAYQFKAQIDKEKPKSLFSYLMYFILNFPLFNLINQPNLDSKIKEKLNQSKKSFKFIKTNNESNKIDNTIMNLEMDENKSNKFEFNKIQKLKLNQIIKEDDLEIFETTIQSTIKANELIFTNVGELFEFILLNQNFKNIFILEIQEIIEIMKSIIYTPPFSILFGRIRISIPKENLNSNKNNITQLFYEGIGFNELQPNNFH